MSMMSLDPKKIHRKIISRIEPRSTCVNNASKQMHHGQSEPPLLYRFDSFFALCNASNVEENEVVMLIA